MAGPDLGLVRAWLARYWLAVWFAIISAMRLSVLVTGEAGFDAPPVPDGDSSVAGRGRSLDRRSKASDSPRRHRP